MTDVVDADELLRRIRAARDWAAEREAAAGERAGDGAGSAGGGGGRAADVDLAVFSAVREVLDEIIDPGAHRRRR